MSGFKGAERRGFGRRVSSIHGAALIPGRGAMPCVVRNFSATGALLSFNERLEPPYQFRLIIAERGVDVACAVRHHGRYGTGVFFLEPVTLKALRKPIRRGRSQRQPPAAVPVAVRPLDIRALRRHLAADEAARRRGMLAGLFSD